jgi:hypothetical protein
MEKPFQMSVLLVEETRVHEENHRLTLVHNVVLSTPRHERGSNSQRVHST